MRIAFIDSLGWRYDVDTPLHEPLGGSQSALCYLAAALAERGHDVTIYNEFKAEAEPVTKRGVTCRSGVGIKGDELNAFDVIVGLNNSGLAPLIKPHFGVKVPCILWQHHGWWQPAAEVMRESEVVGAWDAFAFVAEHQRSQYLKLYAPLSSANTVVMYNGMAPPFEYAESRWMAEPPTLFYTSTPFRGLDVLLASFPAIRKAVPGTRLKVFSSMRVYRMAEHPDFGWLYAAAQEMDGVEYRSSIGQAQLADELSGCAAFAHPSTFPECHSIAAIEAMAVGAAVLTTDLGGQPETTGGLATTIPYVEPNGTGDHRNLVAPYTEMVIVALKDMQANPGKELDERYKRAAFARERYRWKDKAADWDRWLSSF